MFWNKSSESSSKSNEDTMLLIEVLNQSGFWIQASSAYPNEIRLSERLAVALRNNQNASRARAIGNKTGRVYDILG
jgi:hypothetical protein